MSMLVNMFEYRPKSLFGEEIKKMSLQKLSENAIKLKALKTEIKLQEEVALVHIDEKEDLLFGCTHCLKFLELHHQAMLLGDYASLNFYVSTLAHNIHFAAIYYNELSDEQRHRTDENNQAVTAAEESSLPKFGVAGFMVWAFIDLELCKSLTKFPSESLYRALVLASSAVMLSEKYKQAQQPYLQILAEEKREFSLEEKREAVVVKGEDGLLRMHPRFIEIFKEPLRAYIGAKVKFGLQFPSVEALLKSSESDVEKVLVRTGYIQKSDTQIGSFGDQSNKQIHQTLKDTGFFKGAPELLALSAQQSEAHTEDEYREFCVKMRHASKV